MVITINPALCLLKLIFENNEQDEWEWPPVALLPSYGTGRDAPSGRLSSLIFGTNLTDVVITGNPKTHVTSQAFNQMGGD